MKYLVAAIAIAAVGLSGAAVAKPNAKGFEIVERDAKGKVTKVKKDGQEYKICTSDDSDGCINPREAGLGYGNHIAREWPGREISRDR
jgi:hypothetical protein